MPVILPHTQSLLFYLHQQACWKDSRYLRKIHAPLGEANGSYVKQSSTTEIDETIVFQIKNDKKNFLCSFLISEILFGII